MDEIQAKANQSKASAAIEYAISVFDDVLQDISGWEDNSLSEAVTAAKEKLLSALMTEFDMPDRQNTEPAWMGAFDEARDSILNGTGSLKLPEHALTDDQTNAVLRNLDQHLMPHLKRV